MPFITFLYRIGKTKRAFYGKYVCDSMSDDHDGLDDEIKPTVITGINKYREQRGFTELPNKQLLIGILSYSTNECIPTYSSDKEIQCFDFYYKKYNLKENETYINGILVKS